MRKAASTRVFWEADFAGGVRGLYAAAGQKASAERPAEMLLDGSPIEQMGEPVAGALAGFVSRQ